MKRKMGFSPGICFYKVGYLRIRRLHASTEGELIDRQINVLAEKTQAEIGRGM